jgi:type VI protein secretion system component Hcp
MAAIPQGNAVSLERLGASWQLAGKLKQISGGLSPASIGRHPIGPGKLALVRRCDYLSSQIAFAATSKQTIPQVTITLPSGVQLKLAMAAVTGSHPKGHRESPDTFEYEELELVFQKIAYTWAQGGTSATDDWATG